VDIYWHTIFPLQKKCVAVCCILFFNAHFFLYCRLTPVNTLALRRSSTRCHILQQCRIASSWDCNQYIYIYTYIHVFTRNATGYRDWDANGVLIEIKYTQHMHANFQFNVWILKVIAKLQICVYVFAHEMAGGGDWAKNGVLTAWTVV